MSHPLHDAAIDGPAARVYPSDIMDQMVTAFPPGTAKCVRAKEWRMEPKPDGTWEITGKFLYRPDGWKDDYLPGTTPRARA